MPGEGKNTWAGCAAWKTKWKTNPVGFQLWPWFSSSLRVKLVEFDVPSFAGLVFSQGSDCRVPGQERKIKIKQNKKLIK